MTHPSWANMVPNILGYVRWEIICHFPEMRSDGLVSTSFVFISCYTELESMAHNLLVRHDNHIWNMDSRKGTALARLGPLRQWRGETWAPAHLLSSKEMPGNPQILVAFECWSGVVLVSSVRCMCLFMLHTVRALGTQTMCTGHRH